MRSLCRHLSGRRSEGRVVFVCVGQAVRRLPFFNSNGYAGMIMDLYEILPSGQKIYTDKIHNISQDGLLLAAFANPSRSDRVIDFGCGCGVIGFNLAGRVAGVTMIDISAAAVELAKRTAAEGGFTNTEQLVSDIRVWKSDFKYDAVICNPPYFSNGRLPAAADRAAARHQCGMNIGDLAAAAARALKQGGSLYLCFPPSRLAGLFCELKNHKLEPKTLSLVKNRAGRRWLALVRAVYCGGEGLDITDDILSEV